MTTMTLTEQIITIGLCVAGTMATRFIQYLGKALPAAIFGMLVIYCLKNVTILSGSHGIPELIAIAVTILLHFAKNRCSSPSPEGPSAICFLYNLFSEDSPCK